ncbi:MAG: UDP-glucose 4-epimerase, partial [Gemmatimonadetes bacterium]|nr:UDP-glucose 4-epimerase [Gemmatimonadota bacterium]
GTGLETSVNELAATLIDISGSEATVSHAPARAGELLRNALDCTETRAIGWEPAHTLEMGLRETYAFIAEEVR